MAGANSYIQNIDYNEFGQVAATYLSTGSIVSQPCYNSSNLRVTALRVYTGALQSCVVVNPANARLNLQYQYFNNGNVQQIVDATRSETLTYTYDDLDRLVSATAAGGAQPYSQAFAYNPIGNLTSKAGVTLGYTAQSGACPNGALSKPHAATSAGSDTYCYDQNGNMVRRTESGITYTQNFNAENMVASVVTGGQTTTFVRDGDNNLVKKVNPDGTYTVYLGVYEVEYNASNVATKKTRRFPTG